MRVVLYGNSLGHGAGFACCTVWFFTFSGDHSSNQNDLCTLLEILPSYFITPPEILAFKDSFVNIIVNNNIPGKFPAAIFASFSH
jgi:hypothetical protein